MNKNEISPATLFIIRTDAIANLKAIRSRIAGYEMQMFMAERKYPEAVVIIEDRIASARREEKLAIQLLQEYNENY